MQKSALYLREVSYRPPDGARDYPFDLPVVRNLETLRFPAPVTFLVGENGAGKSTLLEAIAVHCGFNAEGGSKNFRFATQQTHSALHEHLRVVRGAKQPKDGFFLRAESFYNVASEVDRLDAAHSYGGVSLHGQSHGESFFSLLRHRFFGHGLYLLDEPEAALSPVRQLAVLRLIKELCEMQSQFIISTHSPILMAYPGAVIYEIRDSGISEVPYEHTEHYQISRQFFQSPQRMLEALFAEEE